MARFYRPRGHKSPAVLWDPKAERAKYEFVNGVCDTDAPETINLLREMGFSEQPMSPAEQQAADIHADLVKPPPPPPPLERTVPAIEPKVRSAKGKE